VSWIRVPGPEFIGPFPSTQHAREFIERAGLRVAEPVDRPEDGTRHTIKAAETILKTAPGWFA
jgi:hypothetical protein